MPSTASVQLNRSNRLMRTHPDGGVLCLRSLQDGKMVAIGSVSKIRTIFQMRRTFGAVRIYKCVYLRPKRRVGRGCRPAVWNESSEVCVLYMYPVFLVEVAAAPCENPVRGRHCEKGCRSDPWQASDCCGSYACLSR